MPARKVTQVMPNTDYLIMAANVVCKLQLFLVNTCGTSSAWFIVSMTTQRVMSIVWPHYKSLSCTGRQVSFIILSIVAVCTAINGYRLRAYVVATEFNSTTALCTIIDDEELKYFDWYIYPWIDLVVTSLIPFSILIVGNSVLVWKVIQSVHVARVMTAGGCDQVNSRQKKASSSACDNGVR
ncbi:uncharacterized protein LOC112570388 [Pomacea canaliculata]|uniref:uncharacterized protein LOC112570388 n=1 Tax=Pomacea canaliculata TaxID=400727 RepID=UPI000D7310FB|nr:uncharacterized protein LOC112570388 [Pomacea canaliculata]